MQEWLDLGKVLLATAVLVLASRQDWRERVASDAYWLLLGSVGLVLLSVHIEIEGIARNYHLVVLATAILFLDIFWDGERHGRALSLAPYGASLVLLAAGLWGVEVGALRFEVLLPFILYWVFLILYLVDVIKGGADAKCLISLSMLFPLYPSFLGLPLLPLPSVSAQLVLPFPVMVLFFASLFSLLALIWFVIVNMRSGDLRLPYALLGFRMDLDRAEKGHYWPMEKVLEDGTVALRLSPQGEGFEELRAAGVSKAWVTPKIPLLIPMTAAVLLISLLGNPLFLIV